MSASEKESAIFTTDAPELVERKIKKYAFSGGAASVEEHRRLGGKPEIDASYQWLTFFEQDDAKLKRLHDDYASGALLSGELKMVLVEKLQSFLKEHQRKRESARKVLDKFVLKD